MNNSFQGMEYHDFVSSMCIKLVLLESEVMKIGTHLLNKTSASWHCSNL